MARLQGLHSWAARRPVAVAITHLAKKVPDVDIVKGADVCTAPAYARGPCLSGAFGRLGLFQAAADYAPEP